MPVRRGRIIGAVIGLLIIFAVVAALLSRVLPQPLKPIDYMVVGSVATLASLIALFFLLITRWVKRPDVFFKQSRAKPGDQADKETGRISTP